MGLSLPCHVTPNSNPNHKPITVFPCGMPWRGHGARRGTCHSIAMAAAVSLRWHCHGPSRQYHCHGRRQCNEGSWQRHGNAVEMPKNVHRCPGVDQLACFQVCSTHCGPFLRPIKDKTILNSYTLPAARKPNPGKRNKDAATTVVISAFVLSLAYNNRR